MAPQHKVLCLLMVGSALACSNSPVTDAGVGDSGTSDSGTGGGVADAGPQSDDTCGFSSNPCATGSCTETVLVDGGIGKRCVAGACDVVLQDCDAGLECAYEDGGRTCVPAGSLPEGASCAEQVSGCQRGLTCTFASADGGSVCSRFCRLDSDCTSPQTCYTTVVLPNTTELPLVCADPPMTCDLLMQNCADSSQACYPTSTTPACYPAGTSAVGASCTFSNDCVKGSACVGNLGARSCRSFCAYPTGIPECATGACMQLSSSATVGACI
jgi:hypothetical protein